MTWPLLGLNLGKPKCELDLIKKIYIFFILCLCCFLAKIMAATNSIKIGCSFHILVFIEGAQSSITT